MKKIAYKGLLLTIALILSYVEFLLPYCFAIPGIKLGLANLAVVLCMYYLGGKDAFLINICRILLAGFLFGNLYTILYSLVGGVLSFVVMLITKKLDWFSIKGVSALGGIAHNIGQLLVAYLVVETVGVFYYLPWLLISGVVTGVVIGYIAQILCSYLNNREVIK